MRIRHYRNGSELHWIINDENYDFNYQTNRRRPEEVLILPGDQITAECIYDTNWKGGKSVIGGQSTDDEMCMVFLAYYPEIPELVGCQDEPDIQAMLDFLGIQAVDRSSGSDPEVTVPEELKGKLFSEVVEEFDWTAEKREQYQLLHQFGNHSTTCQPQNYKVVGTYPSGNIYEPPPKQCQVVTTTTVATPSEATTTTTTPPTTTPSVVTTPSQPSTPAVDTTSQSSQTTPNFASLLTPSSYFHLITTIVTILLISTCQ